MGKADPWTLRQG